MTPRLGFGIAVPAFRDLLATLKPAHVERVRWAADLEIETYVTAEPVPDLIVSSARAIVLVADGVVVCETPNDHHLIPGGHRQGAESIEATARREVYEETGWRLGPMSRVGFMRLRQLEPVPDDFPYPNPDCLWTIDVAFGVERAVPVDGAWVDTVGGWERGSQVLSYSSVKHRCANPGLSALLDAAVNTADATSLQGVRPLRQAGLRPS